MMKKVFQTVALIFCFVAGSTGCVTAASKGPHTEDGTAQEQSKKSAQNELEQADMAAKKIVVARVNGAEITMFALIRMMNRVSSKAESAATRNIDEVKQEALNRLVLQELAYQKARAAGLTAPQENIDAALANLKENVGGEEGYRQFLEREQVTEQDLAGQVERSLTLERIFSEEVYEKIAIPEDELKTAYEQEKGKYVIPEKVSIVDVFFPGRDGGDSLAKKAENIRAKILRDKNRDPWQLVLDGTFIVRNYNIQNGKDPELREEAKKLKKDDISGVIKTTDGSHIIKLREYAPERQLTIEEIRGSLEKLLRAPAQEKRLREWEQELKKDAAIEIVSVESAKEQIRRPASPQHSSILC